MKNLTKKLTICNGFKKYAYSKVFKFRVGAFFLALILGNLVLRIIYEFSLIMLVICRNTIEINNKLNKKD